MTTLNLKSLTSEQRDAFIRGWQNAFGATDDADTLRSEERVAVRDAQTDEEEREAVRRRPW